MLRVAPVRMAVVRSPNEPAPTGAPARRIGLSFASAVTATLLVFLLRAACSDALGERAIFLPFVLAVTLAAWLGGLRPGLFATTLGALLGWYTFLAPVRSFQIPSAGEASNLLIFVVAGVSISLVCERMHRAAERALRAADTQRLNAELEQRVAERTAALHESERFAARRTAKLEAILNSMAEGLIIADGEGKLVDMNPAGLALYGHADIDQARRSVGDWDVRDVAGEPLAEDRWPLARVLAGERFNDLAVRLRRRSTGRELIVSCSGAPVPDDGGHVVRAILVVRDVTEQMRADEALKKSEETAQRSLAQSEALLAERETILASERAARAEAERANQMKDEFLAVLSHELRTPMSAILGWASLLRRPGRAQEQIDKGLEVIDRNARHQVQLISDLLDVSRIIVGKLRLDIQPLDVASSVDAAIDAVRAAAVAKGIEIVASVVPIEAPVRGDPARIQQIVTNLLSNAIKFTPRGGRVDVSVAEVGGRVEIAVRDTGRGISADFLPHAFDRFRQADASTTREHGGLGLGLAIVKHLVELHGGSVRVESEGLTKGALFAVTLPCDDGAPGLGAASSYEDCARLAGLRVLVVDDERDARELVKQLLEHHDAEVEVATSAEHALSLLERRKHDLIVSDIGMPKMDGYALIRRVRSNDLLGTVPAIALTAFARDEDRDLALASGYQAHVTKPIEPRELVSTVQRLAPKGR